MSTTQHYYDRLKAAGVPMHEFSCPHCKKQLLTQQNNTACNWDTLASCHHCKGVFWKITVAEGQGVTTAVAKSA